MKRKYNAPRVTVVTTSAENLLQSSYIQVKPGTTVKPKAPFRSGLDDMSVYDGTEWMKAQANLRLDRIDYDDEEDE